MDYGESKWIIYPIGVKVRLMKPDDWDDVDSYYPLENDYAGISHLKQKLEDIGYWDGNHEFAEFQVEPLDPDWKTKHLDACKDVYGNPTHLDEWYCEKESFDSEPDRDSYCEEKLKDYKEHNPDKNNIPMHLQKEWVSEFCKSKGLGRVIPLFLAEYQDDVKWIEEHLTQQMEVKKPDGRGKNPNSLKNLRQFREKEL